MGLGPQKGQEGVFSEAYLSCLWSAAWENHPTPDWLIRRLPRWVWSFNSGDWRSLLSHVVMLRLPHCLQVQGAASPASFHLAPAVVESLLLPPLAMRRLKPERPDNLARAASQHCRGCDWLLALAMEPSVCLEKEPLFSHQGG